MKIKNVKTINKKEGTIKKQEKGVYRWRTSDSYVIYLEDNEFRDELNSFIEDNNLSSKTFANEFAEFLDKRGAEIAENEAEKREKNSKPEGTRYYDSYISKKHRKKMILHGEFDWWGHISDFRSGAIPSLDYGVAKLMEKFFEEYKKTQ